VGGDECRMLVGMGEGEQPISGAVGSNPAFWRAPLEFAVHALVGTFIFGAIAAPAFGAETVIVALESRSFDWVLILGLKAVAYAFFFTDLVLFSVFLWRAAKRAFKVL
jgi:hypothetical protein